MMNFARTKNNSASTLADIAIQTSRLELPETFLSRTFYNDTFNYYLLLSYILIHEILCLSPEIYVTKNREQRRCPLLETTLIHNQLSSWEDWTERYFIINGTK